MVCSMFLIFFMTSFSIAKTVGYVIGGGRQFVKIDISNNTILQQGKLDGVRYIDNTSGNITYDEVSNRLFVVDSFRSIQGIFIYDLKTLKLIKKLDIQSENIEEESAVRVLAAPAKSVFYVKWWNKTSNNGIGTQVVSRFNASTLNKLTDFTDFFLTDKLLISNDGSKIYSCFDGESSGKVDIFSTSDFKVIKSIDLENYFTSGVYGRGIEDFKNERIQIIENDKKQPTDPDNYILYSIDLNSLVPSPKIKTGLEGYSFLFPSGNKVALNETKDISTTSLGKLISLGKIHVYDFRTSKKVGVITLKESAIGNILAVSPDETKLFYYSSEENGIDSKITIIDLTRYSVIGELPAPKNSIFMFFYEE